MRQKLSIILFICFCLTFQAKADSSDIVTYAGGSGNEVFNDVMQLSDGTFLICGGADDIDWVNVNNNSRQEMTELAGLENQNGTGRYAFIMRLSEDLSQVLTFAYLPKGAAEDFKFIKTTSQPCAETGDLYVSGNIKSTGTFSNNLRPVTVFIARLNNNFINGIPTGFKWQHSFWSEGYVSDYHPWDVRNDGKVVLAEGQSHAADYGAILMLDAESGNYTIVPKWRNHRYIYHRVMNTPSRQRDDFIEADYWGAANDYEPNLTIEKAYERDANFEIKTDVSGNPIVKEEGYARGPLLYSRIYTKFTGSADLRSWTQEDFDMWQPDENGSYKKGKYPWDMMFSKPCNPDDIGGSTNTAEYGYTRYRTQGGGKAIYGTSSIAIDRRNNDLYIGMNVSSKLPDGGQPDFEPVVMAYDSEGEMKWWSRLYHETTGGRSSIKNGILEVSDYTTNTSTPDQYVDGIAIDYSKPVDDGEIIVNARCHGNNIENLWEGNTIAINTNASGFKNGYSGNGGDMHLGWLGRMKKTNGQLQASTYVAEAANDAEWGSSVLKDPNLDSWHNPNDGWLKLTTTRVATNTMKVSGDGYPVIIAKGRRTITTANANQKMLKPEEGSSAWNEFVRIYKPDLSLPLYSSLATGMFDTNGNGADNTTLLGVCKTAKGVLVVGKSKNSGNDINLGNVPTWGKQIRENEDAVLFYFQADNIASEADKAGSVASGIYVSRMDNATERIAYDLQGRKLNNTGSRKGIYIVKRGNHYVKICK